MFDQPAFQRLIQKANKLDIQANFNQTVNEAQPLLELTELCN